MRAGEIQKCAACLKGVAHAGHITFYVLEVHRMGLKSDSINRVAGMEQFFGGNVALARVFADEPIAEPVGGSTKVFVCEECAMLPHVLWALMEPEKGEPACTVTA